MTDSLTHWLAVGGPVLIVLLALSVVVCTILIIKAWEFFDDRIFDRGFVGPVLDAWREGNATGARQALSRARGPLAQVLDRAIVACTDAQLSESQRREWVEQVAQEHLESARHLLRPLELIGTLAPLLGLLGTVLGMIRAFQQLQAAGDAVDATTLSGGIAQALLTTAAGLAIAIPAIAVHGILERIIERLRADMEAALTRIFLRAGTAPERSSAPAGAAVPHRA